MPNRMGTMWARTAAMSSWLLLVSGCSGNSPSGSNSGATAGVSGNVRSSSSDGTKGDSGGTGGTANSGGSSGDSKGAAAGTTGTTGTTTGGTSSASTTTQGGTTTTKATGGTSSAGAGTKATGGSTAAQGGASGGAMSNGCGKSAPTAAASQVSTTVGGTARSYFFAPPSNYNPNTGYPLIIVFHGSGGTGESLRGWFTLETAANRGAIFAYPDGLGGIWDLKNDGPDAKLFDQIVADLSDTWCVDKGAVFVVGFSYGGWAATQMALSRPTVVRGIASIAGGGPQGGRNTDPAVAAMLVHGTADTAEPIASSISSRSHFLATNGCGSTTTAFSPSPCVSYEGCKAGKSVVWCEHPGEHGIPDFAAAGIWNFFTSLR